MKNSPFIFTPCLPHYSHPAHWHRTPVLVCWSLGPRPTQVQLLRSNSLEQYPAVCPFSHFSCYLQETSEDTSLSLGLPPSPIDTSISDEWSLKVILRFCCWTLIRLSQHRAWLRQGYWHYRYLIDWLILTISTCAYCSWFQLVKESCLSHSHLNALWVDLNIGQSHSSLYWL